MASVLDRLSSLVRGGDGKSSTLALGLAATAVAGAVYLLATKPAGGKRPVAVIAAIGTAVPENAGTNAQFRDVVERMGYQPETMALVDKIVERAGIETRHTCIADTPEKFVEVLTRGGRARAEVWEKGAPAIALAAAKQALESWQHGSARDITHVVVHSCTGFSAPGLDYHLITELGLKSSTRKIPVHFAGCFGGFTGLYVAKQAVEADPTGRSVVLVCCAETCTAHMSNDSRPELVIGNTVFADGAGAAIVTAAGFVGHKQRREVTAPAAPVLGGADWQWAIGTMSSEILPNSAETMTWKNSAEPGRYDMWLDKSIPRILSSVFTSQGFSLLRRAGISNPFTCAWAIHPGGAAILKAFRKAFDTMHIAGDGLDDSAEVLRANGNMSSATIFFCLQRILSGTPRTEIFTAGFGPGLTVEYGRLYRIKTGGKGPRADAAAVEGDDAHSDDDSSGSVDSVPSSVAVSAAPVRSAE